MREPILAWTLSLALLAAASTVAADSPPVTRPLAIELDASSPLVPAQVTYEWRDATLEVTGRIEKVRAHYGRILGHARIDLIDANGWLIAHRSSALFHFSPGRRNPDWARFHARLEDVPPQVVTIRVRHALGDGE